MIKFGKDSSDYLRMKPFFFDEELSRQRVEEVKKIGKRYRQQPARTECVVCRTALSERLFSYQGVDYLKCGRCGHVNGAHQDTEEFAEFLYGIDGANKLDVTYGDKERSEFEFRAKSIYSPKVEFLHDCLKDNGEVTSQLSVVDLGAGAGHFVWALRNQGFATVTGYEGSVELAAAARQFVGDGVHRVDLKEIHSLAASVEADVVTMIFVLEHITKLRDFMSALRRNEKVRYLYFSVPMFSSSVLLEAIHPDVMPRTLGRGHTHLFTSDSIQFLCEAYGMRPVGEWWFGANAVDIFRTMSIALQNLDGTQDSAGSLDQMLRPLINELQLVFDRQRASSEIHMLTEFVR